MTSSLNSFKFSLTARNLRRSFGSDRGADRCHGQRDPGLGLEAGNAAVAATKLSKRGLESLGDARDRARPRDHGILGVD
jgi:hypothetical protein